MALTKAALTSLFDNYNNSNLNTVQEFMDYLFGGLLPISGGTIDGNLEITGNLTVDQKVFLNGAIYDNPSNLEISVDSTNRTLNSDNGTITMDWQSGLINDHSGSLVWDFMNGIFNTEQEFMAGIISNLLDNNGSDPLVIGSTNASKIGFFGGAGSIQRSVPNTALVTLADVISVLNSMRAALGDSVGYGLVALT